MELHFRLGWLQLLWWWLLLLGEVEVEGGAWRSAAGGGWQGGEVEVRWRWMGRLWRGPGDSSQEVRWRWVGRL